jgi:hypothetical protein
LHQHNSTKTNAARTIVHRNNNDNNEGWTKCPHVYVFATFSIDIIPDKDNNTQINKILEKATATPTPTIRDFAF